MEKNKKYLLFIYSLTSSVNPKCDAYCNRVRSYTVAHDNIRPCMFDLGALNKFAPLFFSTNHRNYSRLCAQHLFELKMCSSYLFNLVNCGVEVTKNNFFGVNISVKSVKYTNIFMFI